MSLRTVAPQTKYGLIKKRTAAAPLKKSGISNAFRDESDDDSCGTLNYTDVGRVNSLLTQRSIAAEKQANKIHSDALAEDPSAFDYDDAYDSFKIPNIKSHALSQPNTKEDAPKSRYISNLMTTASVRGKEKDRIYEKKLLRERKVEDEQYGDKPKFMTTAYKQKLIEDQKWENEDKITDEIEARTDVRSLGMQGFYANLLTKNVAMGGNVEGSALSAYTAGSQRHSQMTSLTAKEIDSSTSNIKGCMKRKYSSGDADTVLESEIVSSGCRKVIVDHVDSLCDEDSTVRAEIGLPNLFTESVSVDTASVPLLSKADIISSARQRFLDRKIASSAN